MTDKQLRRMSRKNLIEILYAMKKEQLALEEELASLRSQLSERELKLEKAGTLSDAVVALNGVMEAAQKTADEYLRVIEKEYADLDRKRAEMISEAEEECRKRKEETELVIQAKWKEFDDKVESYLQTHAELETLLDHRNGVKESEENKESGRNPEP